MILNQSADPEITNLDVASLVHQNVVQLNVSVQHWAAVAVSETMHHLLENVLSLLLFNFFIFFHQLQQIPAFTILHHEQKVFITLKNFVESDNFTVPNFT